MCDIYERGLLPTTWKKFGHDSTLWMLQEDNDPKHISKLAAIWKTNNGVHGTHGTSKTSDLAPVENVWQFLEMNLGRKRSKVINFWFRR